MQNKTMFFRVVSHLRRRNCLIVCVNKYLQKLQLFLKIIYKQCDLEQRWNVFGAARAGQGGMP